jgi:hypothetical protein
MLITSLRRLAFVLAATSVCGSPPLWGQWRLGVEVGAARFWGGSRETGSENLSFVPYRPTTFGIGLERQSGKLGLGLQLQYAEAGLALVGPEAAVVAEGAFTILSISPEAVARLTSIGSNNQLLVHAGPLLEIWDIIDEDARTRLGAQAAVSLDVPLGSRFSAVSRAGLAVTSSPYNDGELDLGGGAPTYERRSLWRRSFSLGLRYQL